MAAIDKTYIKTAERYKEVYDWAMSIQTQSDDLGIEFDVKDFLPREYDEQLNDKGPASPEYIAKHLELYKKDINCFAK